MVKCDKWWSIKFQICMALAAPLYVLCASPHNQCPHEVGIALTPSNNSECPKVKQFIQKTESETITNTI